MLTIVSEGRVKGGTHPPNPHCLPGNRPPRHPQTPPAQSYSAAGHNAGKRGQRLTATPPAARETAPPALALCPRCAVSGCCPRLADLGHQPSPVSKAHVQHRGRDQCNRPDASTATLHAPLVRLQVALQRVAHVL